MHTTDTEDLLDASWLPDNLPEIPDLSPEDTEMVERFVAYAVARKNAQSRRKKEDPINSPSEKISIRIPKSLLGFLREQAALAGVPYQTFIKMKLYEEAIR